MCIYIAGSWTAFADSDEPELSSSSCPALLAPPSLPLALNGLGSASERSSGSANAENQQRNSSKNAASAGHALLASPSL